MSRRVMRLSVERLRWVLIAGAAILVVVLAGFVGYGRYKALKTWRSLLKRTGVTISHDTNGFTYSQSVQGRTVFTLHAVKATQQGEGVWALEDADLTLYSKESNRTDQIYGAAFSYDQHTGVVRALGEVHMDLQAPAGLTHSAPPQRIRGREGRAPSAVRPAEENVQVIHVRTSGLVYTRSTGVATTPEDVEFQYGSVVAHAHGAEFDQKQSTVHLLAQVHMDSTLHDEPLTVDAAKAGLDRDKNVATLELPVVKSQGRMLQAEHAVLSLRKDGSVQEVHAEGAVTLTQGTAQVRGAQLEMTLSPQMAPEAGTLSGGVTLVDTNPQRPMQGAAQEVSARFDAKGQPEVVTATGAARLAVQDPGAVGHVMLGRGVSGDQVVVTMAADDDGKAQVREVHAVGHAEAQGESVGAAAAGASAGERKLTVVRADDLRAEFGPDGRGRREVQQMNGVGHTSLEQSGALGERQTSAADTLQVAFAPGAAAKAGGDAAWQVESAVQTGHVAIRAQGAASGGKAAAVTTARAARAVYQGSEQELTLTGAAEFEQNEVQTDADSIVMEQGSGDATAEGHVVATLLGMQGEDAARRGASAQPVSSHVMAERAKFWHAAQRAEFLGSDARPAKLWHEASQVEAATLTMDGQAKTLIARPESAGGMVSAIFASGDAAQGGGAVKSAKAGEHRARAGMQQSGPRIVHVRSPKMDYSDKTRDAVFSDGVTMQEADGTVRADRAVVFFTERPAAGAARSGSLVGADPAAGSVDHAVALGDVRLSQPNRTGVGDELVYAAGTNNFILSGTNAKPARVADVQQGNVNGATLVFGAGDSTIVVAGETGKKGRVRTETRVEQP